MTNRSHAFDVVLLSGDSFSGYLVNATPRGALQADNTGQYRSKPIK